MGFWGVLLELARAVVPHAAPHVARAVVDAAKERRATNPSFRTPSAGQPSNQSLADAISYLERRLAAAEDKSQAAEERLLTMEREAAERWEYARKLAMGLIVWNGLVTATLIAMVIYLAVRR